MATLGGATCKKGKGGPYGTVFEDGTKFKYTNRGLVYDRSVSDAEVSGVWSTFAHELGHQLSAKHPWGDDTSKKGKREKKRIRKGQEAQQPTTTWVWVASLVALAFTPADG